MVIITRIEVYTVINIRYNFIYLFMIINKIQKQRNREADDQKDFTKLKQSFNPYIVVGYGEKKLSEKIRRHGYFSFVVS